jgi:hypothetical protein
MLKRLAASGINLAVLVVAVVVFLGAFLALNGLAAAQKPPTLTILAAARDLPIGQVLTATDLIEKTVYVDETAALYIPADQAAEVLGGVTALPAYAGQPIFRTAVIAPVGEGFRLAAALAEYPDMSLFPLPLAAANVIAPDAAAFLPGDLVGITVVIGVRPPPPATPTPFSSAVTIPGPTLLDATPIVPLSTGTVYSTTLQMPLLETESDDAAALDRSAPPLAKDLFPQGVMVIAVQGLPQTQPASGSADPGAAVFAAPPEPKLLVLLVPNAAREQLALGLQRADRVFVSLLARGDAEGVTPGFTYWDFEDLFKADREQALEAAAGLVSSPTPAAPAATPGP